jgi:hypothetical protein
MLLMCLLQRDWNLVTKLLKELYIDFYVQFHHEQIVLVGRLRPATEMPGIPKR